MMSETELISTAEQSLPEMLTEKEKVFFDLKGYLIVPAVLNEEEIARLKDQTRRLRDHPETVPSSERLPGGAASMLIDHPAVMRALQTVIDPDYASIRLEVVHSTYREKGGRNLQGSGELDPAKIWDPHEGGRTVNPVYSYQYHNGQIYAGMTRVVWELNEVVRGMGGTMFVPGSHKSNFPRSLSLLDDPGSGVWETYGCPAGSMLVFSEAVRHSWAPWLNDQPRDALFYLYNHIAVLHSGFKVPQEVIDGLMPRHQRFFNPVGSVRDHADWLGELHEPPSD